MPIPTIRLAACAALLLATPGATATASEPTAPPAPGADTPRPIPTRADLNGQPAKALDDAELAELHRGSPVTLLDWGRIYALALIRGREGRPATGRGLAESLDLKALDAQVARQGVGDFKRFREDFLAGHPDNGGEESGFRDPSAEILDLMVRAQTAEDARQNIAAMEGLLTVIRMLIELEKPSDLYQLHLDRVAIELQRARLRFVDARDRYRDGLDALKVRLGLSPRARVAPDRENLAGFREVFGEAYRWLSDPKASPVDLSHIATRLPALEDITIDGHSVKAIYEALPGSDPPTVGARIEEILAAGVRVATRNDDRVAQGEAGHRKGDDGRLELKVRATLRRLLRIRLAYAIEHRRFVLVVRAKDQAQEHLLAPPRRGETRQLNASFLTELIEAEGQILENQDKLVALWTEYHTLRLALFRDLGILPYDDWKSFLDSLKARPTPVAMEAKDRG